MTTYNFDYIRDKDEVACMKNLVKDYMKPSLQTLYIDNGIILPQKSSETDSYKWMGEGGVIDSDNKFVELSGIAGFAEKEGHFVFGGRYDFTCDPVYIDETVLYMGPFFPHWGHFLLEFCTRLWYWLSTKPDIRIAYCGFKCDINGLSGNYLAFLELLGITKEQLIDIRKPTKFKQIIVPEQSFLRDKYITKEYRDMISCVCQNAVKHLNLPSYDKIYFSRTGFAADKEHGEHQIRNIFKRNGYMCLCPEMLSVQEQIYYVHNCKEFVVTIGGASMNAVFAKDNTKRVYIKKALAPDIPGDVFQLDQLTKAAETDFIDCYYKPYKSLPIGYGAGPHLLGVTKELKTFLADHSMEYGNDIWYHICLCKNMIWLTGKWIKIKTKNRIRVSFIGKWLIKKFKK